MGTYRHTKQHTSNRRIQQKDIAQAAGVSISTVSRVLNNIDTISDDLKERVLKAAASLGYQPKEQQLEQINLIISLTTSTNLAGDQFHSRIMAGVEKECRQHDIRLSHTIIERGHENRKHILDKIRQNHTDGLIFMAVDDTDFLREVLALNFRVVNVNAEHKSLGIDTVLPDNDEGASLAVRHLIAHGHRRILHTTHHIRSTIDRRHFAYKAILAEAGIPYDPTLIIDTTLAIQPAYERMKAFLQAPHPEFTAIFCANDSSAIGIIRALQDAGIRVPDDISVVGFDDISVAGFMVPALTTVRIECEEMGAIAVRRLLERTANPHLPAIKIELFPRLIERQSVAPVTHLH